MAAPLTAPSSPVLSSQGRSLALQVGPIFLLHAVRQHSTPGDWQQQQQQHQQTTADNLMPRGNYNCRRLQTKGDGMLRESHGKPRDGSSSSGALCQNLFIVHPPPTQQPGNQACGRPAPCTQTRCALPRTYKAAKLPSSLRAFMRRAFDALGNRYFPHHTPSPPAVTRPCASKIVACDIDMVVAVSVSGEPLHERRGKREDASRSLGRGRLRGLPSEDRNVGNGKGRGGNFSTSFEQHEIFVQGIGETGWKPLHHEAIRLLPLVLMIAASLGNETRDEAKYGMLYYVHIKNCARTAAVARDSEYLTVQIGNRQQPHLNRHAHSSWRYQRYVVWT